MIIQLHTKGGIIPIDSDTVTDEELASLGLTREWLNEYIGEPEKSRAEEILKNSPVAITLPEIWELLRIFGRKLGYETKGG